MARVLVVEDDLPIVTLMADVLSRAGRLVDVVSNGGEVLDALQGYLPDVIMLDPMLRVVHG